MTYLRRICPGLLASTFLVLALSLFAYGAAEAELSYALREWHREDGLLNEVVYDIGQDNEGYLWLSTASGINRFDGTRFSEVQQDLGIKPGRNGAVFLATTGNPVLFSDNKGKLWETYCGGLKEFGFPRPPEAQPINLWIRQRDGTLWSATIDGTLFRLEKSGFVEVPLDRDNPPKRLLSWAEDKRQDLWVASSNALYQLSKQGVKRSPYNWGVHEIRVASSTNQHPWIVMGSVIGRWNGSEVEALLSVPEQLGAHYIRCMIEDRHGALWIATRSRGLYRVVDKTYELVPTPNKSINSLFEDREGNIWAGTGGGGLFRFQVKSSYLFNSSSGLRDDVSLSLCEGQEGWVWLANRDGGFARIRNNTVEVLSGQPGWPKTTANRIAADMTGRIWMNGVGFFCREPDTDTFKRINTVPVPSIRCLFVDQSGRLWIAGAAGEFGYLENNSYHGIPLPSAASSEQVSCIAQAPDGGILVGTTNGRLLRFANDQLSPFFSPNLDQLFPIRAIMSDADGSLWVASAGAGLRIFQGGKVQLLTQEQGLPDCFISQLLLDDFGGVWLGCPRGIFRLEKQKVLEVVQGKASFLYATPFGKNEGLQSLPCLDGYQPNSCKSRDGRLWFTTRSGVVSIDPMRIIPVGKRPVHINELHVDDKPLALDKPIRLKTDVHKIEFRYSVIDLTAPERPQVRYRLDGFDQLWIPGEVDRKIVYPKLPPGHYTLHVSIVNNTDDLPVEGTSLSLVVEPFWWETISFRAALALALLVGITVFVRGIYKRRYKKRLECAQYQTMLSEERARIARDIHDELGASLTQISLLSQSVPSIEIPERHRDHFNQIYTTTSEITRSIDEIVWAIDARHDNLDSLVCYFSNFAQNFLRTSKIRCRLDSGGDHPDIAVNSRVRHNLFLAYKEALNNCVKHSGCSEVVVRMSTDERNLRILISDNGCGLGNSQEATTQASPRRKGHGLANLPLRLAAIQGHGIVRPGPICGTEVELLIALSKLDK